MPVECAMENWTLRVDCALGLWAGAENSCTKPRQGYTSLLSLCAQLRWVCLGSRQAALASNSLLMVRMHMRMCMCS